MLVWCILPRNSKMGNVRLDVPIGNVPIGNVLVDMNLEMIQNL